MKFMTEGPVIVMALDESTDWILVFAGMPEPEIACPEYMPAVEAMPSTVVLLCVSPV